MLPTNPLLNATAPAGPHLPVALLRQYAAGTLAPAAQHRVEAHTLACTRCADMLEGFLQTAPATTDQALAQLQQRLRQRVQQQAAPVRLAQRPRQHRWLAPQLATAAALLLGLVAGGWWAWQQRQHAPAARPHVLASYQAPARPATAPTTPATTAASATTTAPSKVAKAPAATTTPTAPLASAPQRPKVARSTAPFTSHAAPKKPNSQTDELDALTSAPTPADSVAPVAAVQPAIAAAPAAVPTVASAPSARLRAAMPPPPALAASPVGGYSALREYLKKGAAEFEPESRDGGRQPGRVLVRLHLGADGKIEQAEAVRKLRPDYDAEAVRLLKEGPAWVPGITAGRRSAQVVDVPVVFE